MSDRDLQFRDGRPPCLRRADELPDFPDRRELALQYEIRRLRRRVVQLEEKLAQQRRRARRKADTTINDAKQVQPTSRPSIFSSPRSPNGETLYRSIRGIR